jgi:hypothetical protein
MNCQTGYFGDQHKCCAQVCCDTKQQKQRASGNYRRFKVAGVIGLWYSFGILRGGGGGRQNSEGLSRAGKYLG